ncbi:NTP transferase domain-containing protein [Cereibacter sp. SYSU M97828]|nr:NTP transferase domain-containing protein [Cereibacter flavus]
MAKAFQRKADEMATAGILLAAGRGTRFGADKLAAPLFGRPLAHYAAQALRTARMDLLFCVGRPITDFVQVSSQGEQADSLRAGIRAARNAGAARAVIVLADMPLVTAGLIDRVVAACPPGGAAAAWDRRPMPPTCFDAALFTNLERIEGDAGARGILAGLPQEYRVAAPGLLIDIDRPADLQLLSETHRMAGDGTLRPAPAP